MICVQRRCDGDALEFDVVIADESGETRHVVTLSRSMFDRLKAVAPSPERLVEAAFRFLLDRESKEEILSAFDLAVIADYFPTIAELSLAPLSGAGIRVPPATKLVLDIFRD